MKYASLVDRIAGKGARAWDTHSLAHQRREAGDDVILLSVGDPNFDTPEPIVEAAVASLRNGRHHYAAVAGMYSLRQAIADYHGRIAGQQVGPDNVIVLAGAQNGLMVAALCLLEPGDEVIAPEPMYVTYEGVVGAAGATLVSVPTRPEDDFQVNPAWVEEAVGPNTRALLINTPNNPTGAVLRADVIEGLADICRRHDLWLICDEVYAALTFDAPHVSPSSLAGMADRAVTISSLAKSHAMTGWRLGWMIGPEELIGHASELACAMLYGSPQFIQDAGIPALTLEMTELEAMKREYRARRDIVCAALNAIDGLSVHKPEGGMFVMLDIRATGLTCQEFMEQLFESEGVSVLAGEPFGPSAAGHMRITLSASQDELDEGCRRIARFVEGLRSTQTPEQNRTAVSP
jgi:arginine:pyruvate transaminase